MNVAQLELNKRVKTGAAGVAAILLLALVAGKVGLALIAVVVALGMIYEYVEITFQLSDKAEKRTVLLGTTWLIAFLNFLAPAAEFSLLIFSFLGISTYFLVTSKRHEGEAFQSHYRELILSIFGLVYLAFIPLFLPMLYVAKAGSLWAVHFLLAVWMTDTGAYFAGRKYGKKKLFETISPKKTVEGAIGGLGLALFVSLLFKIAIFRSMPWGAAVIVPLFVGSISQIGDLCESFFKRAFNVKDSGQLLPGHGGFFDRFDGVLFGLPMMYLCFKIFS